MHKPPPVVSGSAKPNAVVSGTRINITVLGCGSAQGQQVPPYFIFPGLRMNTALLEGGTTGTDGCVTESGWSNSEVFKTYLDSHLLKYLPDRSSLPVILFYDGHRSHINLGLIQWAKQQNIILFVLPAHTSHVLQPMDVACFGPFERIYNNCSHKFMRQNCGRSITKFDVCQIGSRAYIEALSTKNLQASFRKAGIYPLNRDAVDSSHFLPSTALQQEDKNDKPHSNTSVQSQPAPLAEPLSAPVPPVEPQPATLVEPQNFFQEKEQPLTKKKQQTKKRRYLSYVVSGKAITEDDMVTAIQEHEARRKTPSKGKTAKKGKTATSTSTVPCVPSSPAAGPSGISEERTSKRRVADPVSSDSEEEDDQPCCVCNRVTPIELSGSTSLIFVKWVKCDFLGCTHWTHLKFCTKIKVVRRGDVFFCRHCAVEE